jgi:hypothetical protein
VRPDLIDRKRVHTSKLKATSEEPSRAESTPKKATGAKSDKDEFSPAKRKLVELRPEGTSAASGKGGTFRAQQGAHPMSADAAEHAANSQRVRESAQAVENAYNEGGAPAAAAKLEEEATRLASPSLVDQLIHEARPTLDKISDDLGQRIVDNHDDDSDGKATEASIDHLAAVAERAGDGGVEEIADSLGAGLDARFNGQDRGDVNQFDDAFEKLADSGKGGRLAAALANDLINERGLIDAGNEILNEASNAVDKLREDYDSALGEVQQLEARLATDLAAFGPGLTDEQRDAYVDAFWADPARAEVRDTAHEKGDKLAKLLEQAGPHLEAHASYGDKDSAQALLDAHESLAKDDRYARQALEFAGRVANNEDLANVIDEHTDGNLEDRLSDGIIANALPRVQADIFASHAAEGPAGADAAAAELSEVLGPLKEAKKFAKIGQNISKLDDTLQDIRDGKYQSAQSILDSWDESNKFQRSLKVATLAFGVYTGVQKFQDGNVTGGLRDFLSQVKPGVEVTAGLLGTIGRVDQAAGVARFGAKALPVVGLAIDALQLADDIRALRQDGADAGEIISLLGTGVSLVGDVAEFIPGGQVVGVPLGIAGEAIRAIGGLVSGIISGNEEREELARDRAKLLEEAGVPAATRDLLTFYPQQAAEIGTLNLTRDEFLGELSTLRSTFEGEDSQPIEARMAAYKTAALFGLEGSEALRFIETFSSQDPQAVYSVQNTLNFAVPIDPTGVDAQFYADAQDRLRDAMAVHFGQDAFASFNLDQVNGEDANIDFFAIQV